MNRRTCTLGARTLAGALLLAVAVASPAVASTGGSGLLDSAPIELLPAEVQQYLPSSATQKSLIDLGEFAERDPFIFHDNTEAGECIDAATLTFLAFFPGSLTWGPIEYASELGVYAADLVLKHCAARMFIPRDLTYEPNVRGDDGKLCYRSFSSRPEPSGDYINLLGVDLPNELRIFGEPFPRDWGPFGSPDVQHFNSGAKVRQQAPGFAPADGSSGWLVPTGGHNNVWSATSELSLLDLLMFPIPGPFSVTDQQSKNVKWELAKKMAITLIEKIAESYAISQIESGAEGAKFPISGATALNQQVQRITVWDVEPPTLELSTTMAELVATDPGGAKRRNHLAELYELVSATDECERTASISFRDMPEFFKVDVPYVVTWVARDRGPKRTGGVHEVSKTMTVVARDLHPPDINPPDHIVEISTEPLTEVDLGWPQIFDAVDLDPQVFNNAPPSGLFPLGMTEVTWWAVDQSGNESRRVIQRVNLKPANQEPVAVPRVGTQALQTRTWEDVTVPLAGFDPDPQDFVNFEISTPPAEGFFKAPLYPAFVEDFRVESTATFDELEERCETQCGPWQAEFPYDARYIDVADDGTSYIIDRGSMFCLSASNSLQAYSRLAVFDEADELKRRPDGSFLSFQTDPEGVWIDKRAERIYLSDNTTGGVGYVRVYDLELNLLIEFRIDNERTPPGELSLLRPTAAVADPFLNVLYVTDGTSVRAYRSDRHVEGGRTLEPIVLGTIARRGTNHIRDLEIDSEGNLYLSYMQRNQIHKYTASYFDESGAFVPGRFVGWMGRCNAQLQATAPPVCDLEDQVSVGFLCTDDLCDGGASQGGSPTSLHGTNNGQFNWPRGLAMSPQDVLYVTDYQNDRIQRFTPDGYWAGEAKSTCDGACFVLGAFNSPEDITVNTNHFYLLDQETDLLHVSKTTPIEIQDGLNATVTYSSDYFFQGLDAFEYRVNDGLADSAPARVEIRVGRGRRAPVGTTDAEYTRFEDTPIIQEFTGYDPDGGSVQFEVSLLPEHGEVRFENGEWIYYPNAHFHGDDAFEYRAVDEDGASEPGRVEMTFIANFDPPEIEIRDVRVAGRGFPWQLQAEIADPDDFETFSALVHWGDGTSSPDVPITDDDDEGPFLTSGEGGASLTGRHTWRGASSAQQISACVTDAAGLEACSDATVPVEELVDLAIANDLADQLADLRDRGDQWSLGETLEFTLTVANQRPEGWRGHDVPLVEVLDALPPETQWISASVRNAQFGESCSVRLDGVLGYRCNLVGLAPGVTRLIDVEVLLIGGGQQLTLSDATAEPLGAIGNSGRTGLEADAIPANNAQRIVADVEGGTNPPPPPPIDCEPGGLCLHEGRFRVEVTWRSGDGSSGAAVGVPGSRDAGLFWFFVDSNWEMLVKVLNGCAINGEYWVLAAATTDVGYDLTVRDLWTGQVASYSNSPGNPAPATIDTEALDVCGARPPAGAQSLITLGAGREWSSSSESVQRARRAAWNEMMAARIEQMKALGSQLNASLDSGLHGTLGSDTSALDTSCLLGGDILCLVDQRFRVEVTWRTANGQTGTGKVVPRGTPDSGLFWFFDANNWEMLVKVLDGCGVNDRFWVLAAVTTDVQYELTVTDSQTGVTSSYFNPLGNAADAVIDTEAFNTCRK